MKIDFLGALAPINNVSNNRNISFNGLKMSSPLRKDIVSFSSDVKYFNSDNEAKKYYENIAENVNKALEEDDEISAFEILGYDVDSNFETDKITINGDYNPYFSYRINNRADNLLISYEKVNINQDKLLQNVEKITGKRNVSPDFVPDDNFVIDRNILYPDSVVRRHFSTKQDLFGLLNKRTTIAKEALKEKDTKTALDILGYKNKFDNSGNIILTEGFSPVLLKSDISKISQTNHDRGLYYYNINQNDLLKDVVKIQGKAVFNSAFEPDHFIDISNLETMPNSDKARYQLAKKFILLNPDFQKNISAIKKSIDNGDNYSALKTMGYNVEKDGNNNITVNGDLNLFYQQPYGGEIHSIDLKELDIDSSSLLNNVTKINGSLYLDSSAKTLDKNLEISKYVFTDKNANNSHLFDNFSSTKDILNFYADKNITPEILSILISTKSLIPSFEQYIQYGNNNLKGHMPFFNLEGENKKVLDKVANNRDKILTAKEIQEKFEIPTKSMESVLQNLVPFVTERYDRHSNFDSSFIYDVTNKHNVEILQKMEKNNNKPKYTNNEKQLKGLCLKNSVIVPFYNTKKYPFDNLEKIGYGTKADIMANCVLRMNSYEIKQYILNNDFYNISTPEMTETLKRAKYSNPAIVKVNDLIKAIGENKQDFNIGLEQNKLNIITENPYYNTNRVSEYFINLADEKNQEYLSQIDNNEFQGWLNQKLNDYNEYHTRNIKLLEDFKKIKTPPTQQERALDIQRQLDEIEKKKKADAKKAALEKKQKEIEKKRNISLNHSLRTTIAWVLSPNTKEVMNNQANIMPVIKLILAKNNKLEEIKDELFSKKITYEDAVKLISELNLSQKDEMTLLSYYKSCWEIAGTQEFSQASRDAAIIVQQYFENGIEAIKDEKIKNKIIEWENEHKN